MSEPLIKLDPSGSATLVRYDIPEPTSYPGTNVIELNVEKSWFKPEVSKPPIDSRTATKGLDLSAIKAAVMNGLTSGFADSRLFPNVGLDGASLRFVNTPNPGLQAISSAPVSSKLASLNADELAGMLQAGKRLNVYRSLFGTLTYNYVEEPPSADPMLLLIERYRLSSFLGNYGAGRIIKTFTLLPGEKTKLAVKSFTKTQTEAKSASSILDSLTQESADDFEEALQSEHSDKRSKEKSKEYNVEVDAGASWGWGSASVSVDFKRSSHVAREEFTKSVSSATRKHTSKASAKRDVQINTSYEIKRETGEETSLEREIQNINLSRPLNFIFRQMNQHFVSVLHLIDVRVAFFNGYAESRREYPLPQIDVLLGEVIVEDRDKRQTVKDMVIEQLTHVYDRMDMPVAVIEERDLGNGDKYFRFKRELTSSYEDGSSGLRVQVPGVILAVIPSVMRTEGVIVEAILSEANALDKYAQRLQELEVRKRETEVAKAEAEAERAALVNKLATDNDGLRAKILADLTCPCGTDQRGLGMCIGHGKAGTVD